MKKCSHCKTNRRLANFSKNIRRPDNLQMQCKQCHKKYYLKHMYARRKYKKSYWTKNINKFWFKQLVYRHRFNRHYKHLGLDFGVRDQLLWEQDFKCLICTKKATHFDHCHKTGYLRGYLCSSCNTGLGLFKDSVKLLQKAKAYLGDKV